MKENGARKDDTVYQAFEVVAAKPKGSASASPAPVQAPMREGDKVRRKPSTDQKKTRRLNTKTAGRDIELWLNALSSLGRDDEAVQGFVQAFRAADADGLDVFSQLVSIVESGYSASDSGTHQVPQSENELEAIHNRLIAIPRGDVIREYLPGARRASSRTASDVAGDEAELNDPGVEPWVITDADVTQEMWNDDFAHEAAMDMTYGPSEPDYDAGTRWEDVATEGQGYSVIVLWPGDEAGMLSAVVGSEERANEWAQKCKLKGARSTFIRPPRTARLAGWDTGMGADDVEGGTAAPTRPAASTDPNAETSTDQMAMADHMSKNCSYAAIDDEFDIRPLHVRAATQYLANRPGA